MSPWHQRDQPFLNKFRRGNHNNNNSHNGCVPSSLQSTTRAICSILSRWSLSSASYCRLLSLMTLARREAWPCA